MKSLYEIKNHKGAHVCYQVAKTPKEAVEFAVMYGHRGAKSAELVHEN